MTPMQLQYNQMKEKYPDAILLFRLGDFYECFDEDAETAARILGITLTGRGKEDNRTPMAGIPFHALPNYLPKLLKAGVKVAIAEQMEEPKAGKLVEREIIKVYTPGTVIDEKTLDPNSNNYLASIFITADKAGENYGVAFIDISTGELKVFETHSPKLLKDELDRINPAEIICTINQYQQIKKFTNIAPQQREQTPFQFENAKQIVLTQFGTQHLKGYGIEDKPAIVSAVGGLITYVKDCQKTDLQHIQKINYYQLSDYMHLDLSTIRNLELIYSNAGDPKFTLLYVLDNCQSTMGKRKLRNWTLRPFIKLESIIERQDAVDSLYKEVIANDKLRGLMSGVYDMERIMSRIGLDSANARDLLSLARSLDQISPIVELLNLIQLSPRLDSLKNELAASSDIAATLKLIDDSINPDPPITISESGVIKDGYNSQVDELRGLAKGSKNILAQIQAREVAQTGISSLKIGYNQVFGYYLEVTKTHAHKVPPHFIRKQTLANAERYITQELKELEDKILGAEQQLNQLEYNIFCDIRSQIAAKAEVLLHVADILAELDVLANFAYLARQFRYTKPEFMPDSNVLHISNGRHPVVERAIGDKFIANDVNLDNDKNLVILTGPNMSGKSTYIRQLALLVHMAQMGSFVPADQMQLGLVDRIFTRVGAADNLAAGESTFMVEMTETANILNNATDKSLIILDEVGRGTSTYDGVAIAWSIVEYIHNHVKARTLFATHYHELIQLEKVLNNVINYKVNVNEQGDKIAFTHHISPGSTSRSYGVHVAEIAGVPKEVVSRANSILQNFEQQHKSDGNSKSGKNKTNDPDQPHQLSLM